MPVSRMTKDEIKDAIVSKLQRQFGCDVSDATDDQLYQAAMTTKGMTAEGFIATARVIDKVVKALQEKRFDEAFIESIKAETAAILAEIK